MGNGSGDNERTGRSKEAWLPDSSPLAVWPRSKQATNWHQSTAQGLCNLALKHWQCASHFPVADDGDKGFPAHWQLSSKKSSLLITSTLQNLDPAGVDLWVAKLFDHCLCKSCISKGQEGPDLLPGTLSQSHAPR